MKRFQFTIRDLLVLMTVVAFLLGALLMPAIERAREAARRASCVSNLKVFGVALHNYHDVMGRFPAASQIVNNGGKKTVGGWSFIACILPQMEYGPLYDKLQINKVQDPLTSTDPAILTAKQTQILDLNCLTNRNRLFSETTAGDKEYFTNYKAMCGTTVESLRQCLDPDEPPPYGDKVMHPDGAFAPGRGVRKSEFDDGTSNTILMTETIDDLHSVWLAGADVNLVGMPKTQMDNTYGYYWSPVGFNEKFDEDATPAIKALRTYLAYDFRPGGEDEGPYPASVGRTPRYGPSSAHPGVVNHLFGDGTVRSLKRDIDYALYFFAITRQGNDPLGEVHDM